MMSEQKKPGTDPSSSELQSYQLGQEQKQLEKMIFNHRPLLLFVFLLVTIALAYQASHLKPDASFEKMIPMEHPYVRTMMKHVADLGAAGTTIQVAVTHKQGDIFDQQYLEILRQVNDEVFYLPGVDRNRMRSLWTPNVRWTAVTEEGFEGDRVIDSDYDGSDAAMEQLRLNILRSGEVGRLVANNYRSSIIEAPLFDRDPRSGEPLDYHALSLALERDIRDKYSARYGDTVDIHIVGFAKMVGDLIEGISAIVLFAIATLLITAGLLYAYSRSVSATLAPIACSLIAVVWQLGLVTSLGYGLNAYSILIPFLVFAIGVSHGIQVINAIAQQRMEGADNSAAAKIAFRTLYIAGITALVSDAIGFITMLLIDIEVIQDLGIAASIGVAVIILTNLMLLPVVMSYLGISDKVIAKQRKRQVRVKALWNTVSGLAHPQVAPVSLVIALLAFMLGVYGGQDLQIGDLDKGAPELRPDSRYNLDSAFINANYATSSDILVVLVETDAEACSHFNNMDLVDRFVWAMQNVSGVESAVAASTVSKLVLAGYNEGNLKWAAITRNQRALDTTFNRMPETLMNRACSLLPVPIFLTDHKAATLARVAAAVETFAAEHNSKDIAFLLAAGNAGVEAATNQEIAKAQSRMLVLVYSVVCALIFIGFGSLRAVICIVIPLMLTSVLCQALMASLGIGVKVATLPVIALGVGVGVDYGIYIYSKLSYFLRQGLPLQQAYAQTLQTTGKAVCLTGVALAIGVGTWIWSPIKFQADMGMLLTFMFLWNMVGALWLLPAIAHFLIKQKPHDKGTPL